MYGLFPVYLCIGLLSAMSFDPLLVDDLGVIWFVRYFFSMVQGFRGAGSITLSYEWAVVEMFIILFGLCLWRFILLCASTLS